MAASADWYELLEMSRLTQTSGGAASDGTPVCFVGPPGISKTAITRDYCDSINHHCEVIILGRIPSVDVGGIYAPDFDKGELRHMITRRLLGTVEGAKGKDGVCIFFDEFGNTTDEQQTAIQSIVQDRILEGHPVPDNVWYTFATNPSDANCGSHEITQSMGSRMLVAPVDQDSIMKNVFPRWLVWAVERGNIDPRIVGFFKHNGGGDEGELFHAFDPGSATYSQPNPRNWTKLSRIMDNNPSPQTLDYCGQRKLGETVYQEFRLFLDYATEIPTPEEIIADPNGCLVHAKPGHKYATLSNLASYLKKLDKIPTDVVDKVITYLRLFPETFAVFGFRMMAHAHDDFSSVSNEYGKFLVEHQDLSI